MEVDAEDERVRVSAKSGAIVGKPAFQRKRKRKILIEPKDTDPEDATAITFEGFYKFKEYDEWQDILRIREEENRKRLDDLKGEISNMSI